MCKDVLCSTICNSKNFKGNFTGNQYETNLKYIYYICVYISIYYIYKTKGHEGYPKNYQQCLPLGITEKDWGE